MKKIIAPIIFVVLVLAVMIGSCFLPFSTPDNAKTQYFCDVHPFALKLDIDVENMDGNKIYNVDGEFFSKYEDNLVMLDQNKEIVREMADDYNFVTQNDHSILDGNGILYAMEGNFSFFGNSYNVYNNEKELIGTLHFDFWFAHATLKNNDGEIVAQYDSNPARADYIVSIMDNCEIDDDSVLMMFASGYSDARSDSSD